MADNFLERQYDDYIAKKAARETQKRIAWQKQLKAYKAKMDAQKEAASLMDDSVVALRALEPTDLDLLFEWENDSRQWSVSSRLAPYSRQMLWEYLERYDGDIYNSREIHFVVCQADSGSPVGMLDLFGFDPHNSRAEVGVHIVPGHRRKGYALRALEILKKYAFSHLGINQLYGTIPAFHEPSVALFDKAGFDEQHVMPQWVKQGGEFFDALIVQCLKAPKAVNPYVPDSNS